MPVSAVIVSGEGVVGGRTAQVRLLVPCSTWHSNDGRRAVLHALTQQLGSEARVTTQEV